MWIKIGYSLYNLEKVHRIQLDVTRQHTKNPSWWIYLHHDNDTSEILFETKGERDDVMDRLERLVFYN